MGVSRCFPLRKGDVSWKANIGNGKHLVTIAKSAAEMKKQNSPLPQC